MLAGFVVSRAVSRQWWSKTSAYQMLSCWSTALDQTGDGTSLCWKSVARSCSLPLPTCTDMGATAILEHPACPDDEPTFASIWRLPIVDFLLRFEACVKIRVWQGSPKPTDLLIANGGPRVAEVFAQGRTTPMPKGGQIGRIWTQ